MRVLLPPEFHPAHNFAIYLHDELLYLLRYGETNHSFDVSINLKQKAQASSLTNLSGEDLWRWLEQNEYPKELGELYLKCLFPALLSDLCHFIYEALSCSRKGKLTVAYALLRKPLRENLFYLERLLADPSEFINTFHLQPSVELSLSRVGDKEQMLPIIKAAVSQTMFPETYDPEFLYDLRFNKQAPYGFDPMWNRALHIITTNPHITTEPQNLNFIFSNENDVLDQWAHIYSLLPFLLFYAVDLCEALMTIILKELRPKLDEIVFRRSIGFIVWSRDHRLLDSSRELYDTENHKDESSGLQCPKCSRVIPWQTTKWQQLFEKDRMRCPHCYRSLRLDQFLDVANHTSLLKRMISGLARILQTKSPQN